jgi:hypothetical protein
MLDTAVNLCKEICQVLDKKRSLKLESKLRISIILDEISRIMDDTAQKLKNDEYPHGNCVILQNLSENLSKNLSEYVKKEDLDKLDKSMNESLIVEKYFAERKHTDGIFQIEKASGEFKSLSLLMKL